MSNLLLVLLILAVVALYFWSLLPRPDRSMRQECLNLAGWDFAHRGLWDMELGIPENSMPAFERAIKQHVAIELDVHLTKDNRLVVIHDSDLKRLCGVEGLVEQMTFAELSELRLLGTEETIPLFGQVLRTVRGRVPLLIEIKAETLDVSICSYLYRDLEFYNGAFLVESFNPLALRWMRRHARHIVTGQLAGDMSAVDNVHPIVKLALYTLVVNAISRPDFISYELHAADCLSLRICQSLYRTPVFAWTAQTMNEYRQCRARFASVIFEKILP